MTPVLVLERVDRSPANPHVVRGTLRLGGRELELEVEIMVEHMGFIASNAMPRLLNMHYPSQRAAVMALDRIHSGAEVTLPLDLSDDVRNCTMVSDPFVPMEPAEEERLRSAAAAIEVTVDGVGASPPEFEPIVVVADVVLDGVPMVVRVMLVRPPDAPAASEPLMLGTEFGHQPPLTREQARAIRRELLKLTPGIEEMRARPA